MRSWTAAAAVLLAPLALLPPAPAQGAARSLDIQPGGRQNGLGAAGVALIGDPADAVWWNPAALGFAEWHGVNYTRAKLLPGLAPDIVYQHVAGGAKVVDRFGVGASGTFLSYGESFGEESTEWSAAFAMGYRVLPGLAIGVTAKRVGVDLVVDRGEAAAFDFGAFYSSERENIVWSAGISLQNQGTMTFDLFPDTPFNRNIKMGAALTMRFPGSERGFETGATAVFDFNQSQINGDFRSYHPGLEAWVSRSARFRAAARIGYYSDPEGEIGDLTYGAGLRLAGIGLDYGAIPQARDSGLPDVEKWTIGLHSDYLLEWLGSR